MAEPEKSTPPKPSPPAKPTPPKTYAIEDRNLIESMMYMKQNNLLGIDKSSPKFDSVKEAEDYAKEQVTSSIKDQLNTLKQDISELQKKGYELNLEGIRLLEIPLKVRVWNATALKKDLEAIQAILHHVSPLVAAFKKDLEAKEKEKERLENEKEAKEKAEQKAKEAKKVLPAQTKPTPQNPPKEKTLPVKSTPKKEAQKSSQIKDNKANQNKQDANKLSK